jgi:16S rRNA C967 or C1407 C5-methylase (RsmB/RsmF family)/NOL1/NOP2/fmu family ribosome biogenesis protein
MRAWAKTFIEGPSPGEPWCALVFWGRLEGFLSLRLMATPELSIPQALISSLRGVPGFEESSFLAVHQQGPLVTSVRLNPAKVWDETDDEREMFAPDITMSGVPWCAKGYYLSSRPSFITDPAWHAGLYYVQEASSMFVEQAFLQHAKEVHAPVVLDACAAPGGKSTHLQSLIGNEGLLVSNEVIRNRVGVLAENMQRWGGENVVVTSADPKDFHRLPQFFDVVLVDAPCSGSGLFRRDPEAIREWSPSLVGLCSGRQQRILADLWGSLKDGGLLIYSTCSYSVEEDEDMLDWLMNTFEVETLKINLDARWGVVDVRSGQTGAYGYRFYPNLVEGEGLFLCCLRKRGGLAGSGAGHAHGHSGGHSAGHGHGHSGGYSAGHGHGYSGGHSAGHGHGSGSKGKGGLVSLSKTDLASVIPWVNNPNDRHFSQHEGTVFAVPLKMAQDIAWIQENIYIKQAGIALGQLMRAELIPDPAFALSRLTGEGVQRLELTREQALDYVRRDELHIDGVPKGWALVTYHGHGIGWVKVLQGRINNYYPKNWRVLKR